MKKHKVLYSVLLASLLIVVSLFAFKPITPPMNPPVVVVTTIPSPVFKGMYVNDFNTILGTSTKEDSVLAFITAKGLNALYFYDLTSILGTPSNFAKLDTFIAKAKRVGCTQFAGTRGSYDKLVVNTTSSNVKYNSTARNKLNVFNLENEFWNYEVNNVAGNLPYLTWKIDNSKNYIYCNGKSLIADMYMGHFKDPANGTPSNQIANQIAKQNHRVLISNYVTSTKFVNTTGGNFSAIQERLQLLGTEAQKRTNGYVDVIIIFHGGTSYMHSYFTTHTFLDAYNSVVTAFNKSSFTGKRAIRIKGYMIYGYQQVKTL